MCFGKAAIVRPRAPPPRRHINVRAGRSPYTALRRRGANNATHDGFQSMSRVLAYLPLRQHGQELGYSAHLCFYAPVCCPMTKTIAPRRSPQGSCATARRLEGGPVARDGACAEWKPRAANGAPLHRLIERRPRGNRRCRLARLWPAAAELLCRKLPAPSPVGCDRHRCCRCSGCAPPCCATS